MPWWTVMWLLLLAGTASIVMAQLPFEVPKPAPPSPASLFTTQCGTCHTVQSGAATRQGPNLAGVFLRKAGVLEGFRYSPGFAKAPFVWDEAHLDAWLANPQKLIPGSVMLYRQNDPAIRASIIGWLKEQH